MTGPPEASAGEPEGEQTAQNRPQVCVGAVVVHEGALLVVRRNTEPGLRRWSVPGGRVEPGETLARAVEREVAEETGLAVECGDLLGAAEIVDPGHHFVVLDFEANCRDTGAITPGSDASEVRMVPLTEVHTLPLVDGLLDFLVEHGVLPRLSPRTPR